MTDDLLELQRLDTTADQLAHRRANLPEREAARAASSALADHRRQRTEAAEREQELALAIDSFERDAEQLGAQRTRLEGQLKTVTAARQAEALLHELETIGQRRDALDDQELASLEEQSQVVEAIAALDAAQPGIEAASRGAEQALAVVEAEIDGQLASVTADREALAGRIPPDLMARYERLRSRHGGVAVARLEGSRCSGCHLDLSTTELEEVRAAGAGQLADCPQCGRMLVS